LAEKLEKDEIARVKAQVERLGPDGLAKAEDDLKEAKAEHDQPIPSNVLTSFPVPDVKSISWIPVQSLMESGVGRDLHSKSPDSALSKHVTSDGDPLPFFVQYNHVQVCSALLLILDSLV
jgi:hypothetical protein